jgi:tetrahydromethanopterin S-methyltransferase subunit F
MSYGPESEFDYDRKREDRYMLGAIQGFALGFAFAVILVKMFE